MATARQADASKSTVVLEAPGLSDGERPEIAGKFFFRGGEKLFLRGVTYGPFAPGPDGEPFPARERAAEDFGAIRTLGGNTVRTFTAPPVWFLDLAREHGLWVLAGLSWTYHTCFLDDPEVVRANRDKVRGAVEAIADHPAILAYVIANEIPPDIVRWYGPEAIAAFLADIARDVRKADPKTLLSYANFPSTEYLDLEFIDFVCFNVYLHDEAPFRRYLSRLQNLAGDKPLVVTEFGIDSIREGETHQAEILARQLRVAFEEGAAGTFVFAWTDEWFRGGMEILDWAFGLVDRERRPKPAYEAVRRLYASPLPPALESPPKVSVVICAYNAERTMEDCLESLLRIRYQPLEVIVVDDGSTDRTLEISKRYPFRIIHQENRGLSIARNVGIEAATGEIVAFTDSDCVADPDWLTYLVGEMQRHDWVAIGGPNLPPPEDARVPACVAVAPGGPTHVLINDDIAEHIPGCNMAFRKDVLLAVDCFDPQFTAAGDDVDLCWRLQNRGWKIGFSPGATVWHFRRNTVRAYLKQQRGYGKAEALLYFKHPYRFNLLGQSRWLGRIYGGSPVTFMTRRPVIYYGAFGRGLFQTLYEPPSSLLSFLPFTLEWNVLAAVLLLCALVSGNYLIPATIPLAISWVAAFAVAMQPRVDPRYEGWRSRALLALLTYLGPILRSYERYRWRLRGLTNVEPIRFAEPRQEPAGWLAHHFQLAYWSEESVEKEGLIQGMIDFLLPRKHLIDVDRGWNDWDIEVHRGLWAKSQIAVAVENHSGQRRLLRVRCRQRPSGFVIRLLGGSALWLLASMVFQVPEMVTAVAVLIAAILAFLLYRMYRLGEILYHVMEIVSERLGLLSAGR